MKKLIVSSAIWVAATFSLLAQAQTFDAFVPQAGQLPYPLQVQVTIKLASKEQADAFQTAAHNAHVLIVESSESATYPPVRLDGRALSQATTAKPAGPPASQEWTFKLAPLHVMSRDQLGAALATLGPLSAYITHATISFQKTSAATH